MSGGSAVLRAEGVRVRYGGQTAVAVDELELREGELLVLLGPNGAGKSTLMRVLALLEEPDEGRVRYRGAEGAAAAGALRDEASAVFQRPHLWSGTVADNLRLALRLAGRSGGDAGRRLRETAGELGLEGLLERDVDGLSAGQAQRVALARSLATDPRLLFLDEPTASLDSEAREALRRDVERFARRGGRSTLLITHDRREAFRLADRIAVMEDGRLVRTGTPDELYERPGSPYVARVSGAELTLSGRVAPAPESGSGTSGDGGRGEPPSRLLEVDVEGVRLLAVGTAGAGEEVTLAYRPEDLALAAGPPDPADAVDPPGDGSTGTGAPGEGSGGPDSVRNDFPATVEERRDVRGLVRVRLRGPPDVVAVVTRGSARALDLAVGSRVRVRVKAAALHAFPR